MSKCNFCGTEIKDFENFCPKCGNNKNDKPKGKRRNYRYPKAYKASAIILIINIILLPLMFFLMFFSLLACLSYNDSYFRSVNGEINYPRIYFDREYEGTYYDETFEILSDSGNIIYNINIDNVNYKKKTLDYSIESKFTYNADKCYILVENDINFLLKIDGIDCSNDYAADYHYNVYNLPSNMHEIEFRYENMTSISVYKGHFAVNRPFNSYSNANIRYELEEGYKYSNNRRLGNNDPAYYITESDTPKHRFSIYEFIFEHSIDSLYIALVCLIPTTTLFIVFSSLKKKEKEENGIL